MKYFANWQDALVEYTKLYGHNYPDGYNLVVEFEQHLRKNRVGAYYLLLGDEHV